MINYNNTPQFHDKCESKGDLFSIAEPHAKQYTSVTVTCPIYIHPGTCFSLSTQAFQEGILLTSSSLTKN